MKELPVDTKTLDKIDLCEKCGSKWIVTSVHYLDRPDILNGRPIPTRWVCKPCYNTMLELQLDLKQEVMFGHEGLLDENLTVWDLREIGEKHDEFNERFLRIGCRTRFKLWEEPFFGFQMQMVVYRDEFQRVAAVREAESVMREVCEGKMRFVKRRSTLA